MLNILLKSRIVVIRTGGMCYMDFLFCFQRLTRRWMWSPCPHFLSAGQRLESASWCHVQEWLGLVREDTGDVDPRQGPRCQGFPPSCTWSPPQAMMSSRAISCEELCSSCGWQHVHLLRWCAATASHIRELHRHFSALSVRPENNMSLLSLNIPAL